MKEISMGASSAVLDFTHADMKPNGKPMMDPQGRLPERQGGRPAKSLTPKQIRARARRARKISETELEQLYKPLDEWDAEELARGRPRAKDGSFKGKAPAFIDRALHEQIVRKFEEIVRLEMNGHTVKALKVLEKILEDDETDEKGKPIVPASTKLDAAKFLVEHVLGKPKQRVEQDISVKLQGILATAMVNPSLTQQGSFELTQGYLDAEGWEEEDDVDSD
jgi:hypothetical protein